MLSYERAVNGSTPAAVTGCVVYKYLPNTY